MPPAWSSLPATGLNLTSTYPSFSETSFFTHHGNVPSPDCLSTFGLLGAVASAPLPISASRCQYYRPTSRREVHPLWCRQNSRSRPTWPPGDLYSRDSLAHPFVWFF